MKLAGTDGFGIPERWEFLDGNSDGNFKLLGCSNFQISTYIFFQIEISRFFLNEIGN